jgi:adenosylmethionine-8-amino-7-oxononanoate aminotransferase
VKEAMREQISNLAYCHSAQFTAPAIEEAGEVVISRARIINSKEGGRRSNFDDGAVTFFSGGAEAIEAAVKIALQYLCHVQPEALPVQIVGRRHSYHGNSVFTLALGDHPRKLTLQHGFNLSPHVARIEAFAPDIVCPEPTHPDDLKVHTAITLRSLEQTLLVNAAEKRRCIVVIETVGGTTLGIAPPTLEYLIGVRKLCDAFEAILIYDEILCANFRTGRMTAWQYYQEQTPHDLAPDIFVMGKGITAGYFPMSAVVVSGHIREVGMADGKVWHTSTNQNHVIGCAALCAAFEVYQNTIDEITDLSAYVKDVIKPGLMQSEHVKNFVGVGLLWGVQFDPHKPDLHLGIKKELMRLNYTAYSDGDTIFSYGRHTGNMIMFAPPFCANSDQLDAARDAIVLAADRATKDYL